MQESKKNQDVPTSLHSPEMDEFESMQRRSKWHLLIFVLGLVFLVMAGSAAFYRYIQRQGVPQKKQVWSVPLVESHAV